MDDWAQLLTPIIFRKIPAQFEQGIPAISPELMLCKYLFNFSFFAYSGGSPDFGKCFLIEMPPPLFSFLQNLLGFSHAPLELRYLLGIDARPPKRFIPRIELTIVSPLH
jgi:hypothetical protein